MADTGRRALVVIVLLFSMMLLLWWLAPDRDPATVPQGGWVVQHVIDGDTIVVERDGVEERVRLIGIDTPERDECGYEEARDLMVTIVEGEEVTLVGGATTDRDVYDRLLRYVEYRELDVGLAQIAEGFAVARYDSRTNQPHPRESLYREADEGTVHICDVE